MTERAYWILVCGCRRQRSTEAVHDALGELAQRYWIAPSCRPVLTQGGATGVDRIAKDWARAAGIPCVEMGAPWECFGRSAGPVRNQWMLDYLPINLVLAMPSQNSRGTWDMIKRVQDAKQAGRDIELIVREVDRQWRAVR